MSAPKPIDITHPEFAEYFDELPLWSAPFAAMLLERVPLRRGQTVLDVGAGTGFLTVELAQRCGPDARIVAVDPWPAAVARLRRKLAYHRISNVRVLDGDAACVDLPDAAVDVVVCNLGINNFDDPDAVLRECVRVMKPGARLVLTTNLTGHFAEFYAVLRTALLDAGGAGRLPLLEEHIAHRGTIDSIAALLERAGLHVRSCATDSFRMRYADGTSFLGHAFIRVGFLPAWLAIPGADAVDATFALLEDRLNAAAAEAGELSLTVQMACIEAEKPG